MRFTIDDLLKIASEPTPFLVQDLIPEHSFGVLVGEWGLGKSPLALQLQLCMATGRPFLNRYTINKTARVLYVDLENGANSVVWMLNNIHKHLRLDRFPETWTVYSPNYVGKEKIAENLREDAYIHRLIKQEAIDFVVIDPLRMYRPEAESKNSEAAAMIRGFRSLIAETGATIMCIHHPRKISGDPTAQRFHLDANPTEWMANACGAGALIQNADFRIGLERSDDGYVIMRSFLRNKGWSAMELLDRDFDLATEEPIGYCIADHANVLTPLERQQLAAQLEVFSLEDIRQTLGKGRTAAYEWLKRLDKLGFIIKTPAGWMRK